MGLVAWREHDAMGLEQLDELVDGLRGDDRTELGTAEHLEKLGQYTTRDERRDGTIDNGANH